MTWLERLERKKARSVALFASSPICADGIRAFIAREQGLDLHLVLPDDGPALFPSTRQRHLLAGMVINENDWPANVKCLYLSNRIDLGLVVSVARLIWFVDGATPCAPIRQSGSAACMLNVVLGRSYGVPLICFDPAGMEIRSPLHGALADFVTDELRHWQSARRALTDKITTEGLVLSPYPGEPALWSVRGGGIDAGALDLPPGLIWRIRRLEFWMEGEDPNRQWSAEEEKAFSAEIHGCAAALRHELAMAVVVRGWPEDKGK